MLNMASRVRVYLACSLDGFIAGPEDDLSFLQDLQPEQDVSAGPSEALGFADFLAQVGAMLMGRRTHDVVAGMGVWSYGDIPVLVATHRPLVPAAPTARAVQGDIATLIAQARRLAGEKDVYLDGGDLIRQALDAGLVDELCITVVPTLLGGQGVRLFDGLLGQTRLVFVSHRRMGAMLQLTARVLPTESR